MEIGKQKIITLFNKKVRGKSSNTSKSNQGHDGKGGHWLEKQMGVKHNDKTEPDLFGYEMKNNTSSKTTFGDWSADYYIYKDLNYFTENKVSINKDKFITIFGSPNPKKNNRYSWSGKPVPKIGNYNDFGQKLVIDKNNNILAVYSFSADKRGNKRTIVPSHLKKENLVLVKWSAKLMKANVEDKFNQLGWFKCEKDKKTGIYTKIVFGNPINFTAWIKGVKKGFIIFDSGMAVGKSRLYSSWRANNKYWDSLITSTY